MILALWQQFVLLIVVMGRSPYDWYGCPATMIYIL
jgi:hypothetical protein